MLIDPATHRWREVREVVLARDQHACVSCGIVPDVGEMDIHHLVPRAAGGMDDPSNLITLCDGCHAARHPNLQAALARRTLERWALRVARWLDRRRELEQVDDALGAALRLLGVDRFRSPQLEVVLAAIRGESVLLVSATGSGKTLCFQLPILLSRGVGVVISPLKALMSQQVSALQGKQIPGTFINGDLSPTEKQLRYSLLRGGVFKFLFCTPERFDADLVHPAEVEELSRIRPSFLVVDEAHCIDRWGLDFRPNYHRLGRVRQLLGNPPVLAFTATAGRESQQRILRSLGLPKARVIVTGVNRPNISLCRLADVPDVDRYRLIGALLDAVPTGRAMLFVPTVRLGQQLQQGLRSIGREVPFYHARLGSANDRDMLLGQFTGRLAPAVRTVICTSAFGMGLDVPDVRLVVHWQHPASVEDYLQEFGRAGRDGGAALAVLFTSQHDTELLRFMAEKTVEHVSESAEARAHALDVRRQAITVMHRQATARDACFRQVILRYFGEGSRRSVPSMAVRLLEWVFQRAPRGLSRSRCCDHCDAVSTRNVSAWAARIFSDATQRT